MAKENYRYRFGYYKLLRKYYGKWRSEGNCQS